MKDSASACQSPDISRNVLLLIGRSRLTVSASHKFFVVCCCLFVPVICLLFVWSFVAILCTNRAHILNCAVHRNIVRAGMVRGLAQPFAAAPIGLFV